MYTVTNRRNPLLTNRRHRRNRRNPLRYNPGVLTKISNTAGKVPFVGMILKPAVQGLSGAGFGALSVYPTHFLM